jgi:chromosome segregation ATPase
MSNQISERIQEVSKELDDAKKRQRALEEKIDSMSTSLEYRADDMEGHLVDLSRKVSANDHAIENLKYDLNKEISLRLAEVEVKIENADEYAMSLHNKIRDLGANVEQLTFDVADLKSGITKYIDDAVKKLLTMLGLFKEKIDS